MFLAAREGQEPKGSPRKEKRERGPRNRTTVFSKQYCTEGTPKVKESLSGGGMFIIKGGEKPSTRHSLAPPPPGRRHASPACATPWPRPPPDRSSGQRERESLVVAPWIFCF